LINKGEEYTKWKNIMAKSKFSLRRDVKGKTYFVLVARNGEPILTSEQYESKQGRDKGIASVRKNVYRYGAFKRSVAIDGQFFFTLRANNNKVIGVSETYKSKWGREVGILSVRLNAVAAKTVYEPT
jgi:uncharacterized protein YegP (UPF0339 family)